MSDIIDLGQFVDGEKPEPFVYTFQDAAGNPIDLTGYTAVSQVRRPDGTVTEETDTDITGGPEGEVTHFWKAAHMDVEGIFYALIWVGNNTNLYASKRLRWEAAPNLGTVPSI